jgi:hypothetical protein
MARAIAVCLAVVLALGACGDDDVGGSVAAPAPSASESATTTTDAPASTITTTTSNTGPTTTVTAPYEIPPPEVIEQHARAYCASWPAVGPLLSEDASIATIFSDDEGEPAEPIQGHSAVLQALDGLELVAIECGGPASVAGDWIAIPVSAYRDDGSGIEGIWVFRAGNERISWHLSFGTEVDEVSAVPTEIDPLIEAESETYCQLFVEPSERGLENILSAMTDDPAIHAIPLGYHYSGIDGVRLNMTQILSSDRIGCLSDGTTNGAWSAGGSWMRNPEIDLELIGINVMLHRDGLIHRHFVQMTQLTGIGRWGLRIDTG